MKVTTHLDIDPKTLDESVKKLLKEKDKEIASLGRKLKVRDDHIDSLKGTISSLENERYKLRKVYGLFEELKELLNE